MFLQYERRAVFEADERGSSPGYSRCGEQFPLVSRQSCSAEYNSGRINNYPQQDAGNGILSQTGFLYSVEISDPDSDTREDPESVMFPRDEVLTVRELKVKLIQEVPPGSVYTYTVKE